MSWMRPRVYTFGLLGEQGLMWVISVNGEITTVGRDRRTIEAAAEEILRRWADQDRARA